MQIRAGVPSALFFKKKNVKILNLSGGLGFFDLDHKSGFNDFVFKQKIRRMVHFFEWVVQPPMGGIFFSIGNTSLFRVRFPTNSVSFPECTYFFGSV